MSNDELATTIRHDTQTLIRIDMIKASQAAQAPLSHWDADKLEDYAFRAILSLIALVVVFWAVVLPVMTHGWYIFPTTIPITALLLAIIGAVWYRDIIEHEGSIITEEGE